MASRRRQRVGLIAGRSADQRCWVGAPRARESMDKEEERAPSAADLAIGLLPCLPGCWGGNGRVGGAPPRARVGQEVG